MIEAYVARFGPNPLKLILFLQEVPLPHRLIWLDTGDSRQSPAFLRISPHGKVPALIDHAPLDGGPPIEIFESAAILFYLADKSGRLLPSIPRARTAVLKWLAWQVAALGPTSGQAAHFARSSEPGREYALNRFMGEAKRLYDILDHQLSEGEYLAGDYSIADIACFPWIQVHDIVGIELQPYPHLTRWLASIQSRPAVVRALALAMPPKTS
jgi:GST-like protein